MTRLECNVSSCVHNADRCCCRSAILVDGYGAKTAEDTCCASFDENRGGRFTNLFKTPESRLEVNCDAVGCAYNEENACRARSIGIGGDGASACEQTQCMTYRSR